MNPLGYTVTVLSPVFRVTLPQKATVHQALLFLQAVFIFPTLHIEECLVP